MKKNFIIILGAFILPNLSSSVHATEIKIDFILGTAFVATICQIDMENHYRGTRNCSGILRVGSSHTIKNKKINDTFCISILRWPIIIPVLDEYYFRVDKNENSTIEIWGSAFNPKFSYPDSISMYGTKIINGSNDYCSNIPISNYY